MGSVTLLGAARLAEPLKKSVGAAAAPMALYLDLHTVGDLLRHYPRRYLEPTALTDLDTLPLNDFVTLVGEVTSANVRPMARRKGYICNAVITDGRASLHLTFFRQARYHAERLKPGHRMLFTGKLTAYRGERQLTHPAYEPLDGLMEAEERELASSPIPIYPAAPTHRLPTETIRRTVRLVLNTLGDVPDPLPGDVRERHGLLPLRTAFDGIHRPRARADWVAAQHRLRFEEAFVLQVALARRRAAAAALPATPRRPAPDGLLAAFDERLPFTLTAGQRAVGDQLAMDLAREQPMHRLLQGEVGSGKTVVALRAMLAVVDAGGQAALLAPTEVLAVQHHRTVTAMLGDLAAAGMLGGDARGTRVVLLTGSMPAAARRRAMLEAASGEAGLVIGTHALLQEAVQFADLGLVVVDEQHRFGVEQRDVLRGKGRTVPHLLVMTATPIPRTVAMTVFGDLETSTLEELPVGRTPIATHLVPAADRPQWVQRAWQRLREEVDAGHQAYVVCPRIGGEEPAPPPPPLRRIGRAPNPEELPAAEEEERPPRGVIETLAELRATPALAPLRLETLHGRMPAAEREAVMTAFAAGEVDVLVATTVIEVGVDVPNASAMVVLDAERFGVSQLHQLRGRVGRGDAAGLCLLVTESPARLARERLEAVAATVDGFELARVDLEQRREGDVLGAAQSGGRSSLRMLRVLRDEETIERARQEAAAVVAADPELRGHPGLLAALDVWLDAGQEEYLDRG